MRYRTGFGAAVVALALVMTACAGGGAGAPTTAAPSEDGPRAERESLRILAATKNNSIDPLAGAGISEVHVVNLTGGRLFRLDDDGLDVTPELAESGRFSEDLLSYSVTLKEGLVFSDGTPLTAADVVATVERGKVFEGNAYVGEFQPIVSAQALSDTEVEFGFSRPYPSFEAMLSFPEFAIVKDDEIASDGSLPLIPTLAGAYTASGDVTGNDYELTRNESYVGATASVAQLEFTVVPDATGRLAQVQGGQADFAVGVGSQAITQDVSPATVHATPAMLITQLTFNTVGAPTDDPALRRAISLALNREQIAALAWNGQVAANAGLLPTTSRGAAPGNAQPQLDRAREELAQTACANGCDLSLLVDASAQWQTATATVIEQNLKEIGISVSVQPVEAVTLYDRLYSEDFELALGYFGAFADLPDTTASYCMSYDYGFLSCYSSYRSEAAEAAVAEAIHAADDAALAAAYQRLNDIFEADQPLATLTDYAFVWAIAESAQGYAWVAPNTFLTIAPLEE